MTAGYVLEWLNLLGRGLHVVAGIAWIGASFYFIWLDNHLREPEAASRERGVGGELWAVHGGGLYQAQKYRVAPSTLPAPLHWFKWEAYTTLLSGLFLLAVVYYARADAYLVEAGVTPLAPGAAIVASVAWLAGGWLVYDGLCRSALGRNERALAVVLAVLCVAMAYALCRMFPARAAFLHFGAVLGTIMVLNVFFVIIPGQRRMIAAVAAGDVPDPALGQRGKQRSVHNTYFTLPVLFAMISNHYAFLYGAAHNWLVLVAIGAAGAAIRVYFVARHKGVASVVPIAFAVLLLGAVAVALAPSSAPASAAVDGARVGAIIQERCVPCHAARPSFAGFEAAPKGLSLETPALVQANASRIREQVAIRAMPLGNLTRMTDVERRELVDALTADAAR